MTTENIIRDLKNIEEKYKDRFTSTGEINISDMAFSCRTKIEDLKELYSDLRKLYEKRLYLAWLYGTLHKDRDEINNIFELTYEQLSSKTCDLGMLVDWD